MQQLKIFALLVLAVSAANCYSIWQHNGESRTVSGDVEILMTSTIWKCDRITCPRDTTDRCVVTKQRLPGNSTVVRRENFCYSADNKILLQNVQDETVAGNEDVSLHLTTTRNGSSFSSGGNGINNGKIDPEWEKEFNKSMQDMEKQLEENARRLEEQMRNMQENLNHMFNRNFNY